MHQHPRQRWLDPLHAAAGWGHAAIVALILQASPSVAAIINLQTDDGHTAVMYAAMHGHEAAVEELIKIPGCRLGLKSNFSKTATAYAAKYGHAEVAQRLKEEHRHHKWGGGHWMTWSWSGGTEVHCRSSINHASCRIHLR